MEIFIHHINKYFASCFNFEHVVTTSMVLAITVIPYKHKKNGKHSIENIKIYQEITRIKIKQMANKKEYYNNKI